jgi:hypothetical protein
MSVDFETPTAALFTRLSALAAANGAVLKYATRTLESWDDSPPALQPALMLTSGDIEELTPKPEQIGLTTPMWKLKLVVVLYAKSPDPKIAPSTILNPLIAAVCNALLAQPLEAAAQAQKFPTRLPGQASTTLGGLCASCRVAGTIKRSEGLIGHVAAASIPIEMVIPS